MKLQPIEKPKSLKLKLAYWLTKKQIGKVITPMKVVYARKPVLVDFMQKLFKIDGKKLTISQALKEMIRYYTASFNRCPFCEDMSLSRGLTLNLPEKKLSQVFQYQSSPYFSNAEKAALAYVEEAVQLQGVKDDTFNALKKHYSEEAIVDITWVVSTEYSFNVINRALDIESDGLCELER